MTQCPCRRRASFPTRISPRWSSGCGPGRYCRPVPGQTRPEAMTGDAKVARLNPRRHFRGLGICPSLKGLKRLHGLLNLSMTNLRQGRRRDRVLLGLRATSLTAAAALTGALLLPARGWAAPHSHAHRALPTALHTSAITETASHPGKKGKHGIKSKVDAVPEGTSEHGAGAKGKGKQGKSRRRQSEPVEDVVPMYRAGRESRSRGRESALTAMSSRKGNRRSAFANGPAPLVSRDSQGHGHILPAPRGSRFHEPAREQQAAMPFRTPPVQCDGWPGASHRRSGERGQRKSSGYQARDFRAGSVPSGGRRAAAAP